MQMPQDPILLMSMVNTFLRDQYKNLEALCEDRELNKTEILSKLEEAGFTYNEELNQFR